MKKLYLSLWMILLFPATVLAAEGLIKDPTADPVVTSDALNTFVGYLQDWLIGIAGAVAVAMFTYGGFVFLTAGGSEERIGKGKKIMTYTVLGAGLILFSVIFIKFFVQVLGGGVS